MLIGLDQSNTFVGFAALLPDGTRKAELKVIGSLRAHGLDRVRETVRDVVHVVDQIETENGPVKIHVVLEQAPGIVRSDVDHGPQAAIGWALGRLTGRLEERFEAAGDAVSLVEVSTWRERMIVWSCRWGVLAAPPPKSPPSAIPSALGLPAQQRKVDRAEGGGFLVTWSGCGHVQPVTTYDELTQFSHVRCPTCTVAPLKRAGEDPAEWRRRAWKALACELVAAHWPVPYGALVADAKSRAKTMRADSELAGVADACEAVWIAASQLED